VAAGRPKPSKIKAPRHKKLLLGGIRGTLCSRINAGWNEIAVVHESPAKLQPNKSTSLSPASADACPLRATPRVCGFVDGGAPWRGCRIDPPLQGERLELATIPGALPRPDILRAVGATI
jgi:hypothetical protein